MRWLEKQLGIISVWASKYYYLPVVVNKNTPVAKRVTYFAIASTVMKPLLPSQMTLDTSTSNAELHLLFLYTEICHITCQTLSRLQSNYVTGMQPCRKILNCLKTAAILVQILEGVAHIVFRDTAGFFKFFFFKLFWNASTC